MYLSISIHSSAKVACRIRTAPLNQALKIKNRKPIFLAELLSLEDRV